MNRENSIPEIIQISQMKLVGIKIHTSLNENKTGWLWKKFMPRLKEVRGRRNENLLSVQMYDPRLKWKEFTLSTSFDNWASVEVEDFFKIPPDMNTLVIPKGKYAVFTYRGIAKDALFFFRFIFEDWMPKSEFRLDVRPHFQIMESDYRPDDPEAKETFWVPIK